MKRDKKRPIEFRAWDPVEKEMIYFEHGFAEMFGYFSNREQMDRYHRLIWMQYSGYIDTNGKKIFEGDVVNESRFDQSRDANTAVWRDGMITLEYSSQSLEALENIGYKFEVVGHIYE